MPSCFAACFSQVTTYTYTRSIDVLLTPSCVGEKARPTQAGLAQAGVQRSQFLTKASLAPCRFRFPAPDDVGDRATCPPAHGRTRRRRMDVVRRQSTKVTVPIRPFSPLSNHGPLFLFLLGYIKSIFIPIEKTQSLETTKSSHRLSAFSLPRPSARHPSLHETCGLSQKLYIGVGERDLIIQTRVNHR